MFFRLSDFRNAWQWHFDAKLFRIFSDDFVCFHEQPFLQTIQSFLCFRGWGERSGSVGLVIFFSTSAILPIVPSHGDSYAVCLLSRETEHASGLRQKNERWKPLKKQIPIRNGQHKFNTKKVITEKPHQNISSNNQIIYRNCKTFWGTLIGSFKLTVGFAVLRFQQCISSEKHLNEIQIFEASGFNKIASARLKIEIGEVGWSARHWSS